MRSSDVTFRTQEVPIETRDPTDDDIKTMDIIEIKYPDGKVVAYPADHKSPETGIRYREMFAGKYNAFKNGEPDPDRVAQLESEIKERQDELDGMRKKKAPDDERVQENLGYGDVKPDEKPHDATRRLPGEEPKQIEQPVLLGKEHPQPLNSVPEDKPVEKPATLGNPFDKPAEPVKSEPAKEPA
jgi:hypothetical protein